MNSSELLKSLDDQRAANKGYTYDETVSITDIQEATKGRNIQNIEHQAQIMIDKTSEKDKKTEEKKSNPLSVEEIVVDNPELDSKDLQDDERDDEK